MENQKQRKKKMFEDELNRFNIRDFPVKKYSIAFNIREQGEVPELDNLFFAIA